MFKFVPSNYDNDVKGPSSSTGRSSGGGRGSAGVNSGRDRMNNNADGRGMNGGGGGSSVKRDYMMLDAARRPLSKGGRVQHY